MHRVLRHLHRAVFLESAARTSDGQLLERFVARQEAAAFAALVERHGPMVLGVCRRARSLGGWPPPASAWRGGWFDAASPYRRQPWWRLLHKVRRRPPCRSRW